MKLINRIFIAIIALVSTSLVFTGCNEDELDVAKAVMASATSLTFDGQGAPEQIITVYSDKTWTADVPEWVTINPTTGSGTTDVTVSVSDNLRGGSLDNPRKAELVFHGSTLASRSVVVVNQNGDKFRDVAEVTVSQATELQDEAVVIIKNSQVTALTTKGFIVSDGSKAIYVLTSEEAKIGDNAEIWGTKETENKLPVISGCEKIILSDNSTVNYPDAIDITTSIDSYNATSREFVKATGTLSGNSVTVEGATTMRINILDAPASDEFEELNNHNVVVYGYFAGVSSPVVNIIVAGFEDLGVKSGLIFSDDFSWMAPYVTYYNSNSSTPLGKSVEDNNDKGNAPNAYTDPVVQASGLMEALAKKGYEDINAGVKSIYPQDCYWKFGKTNAHTGFKLPVIKYSGDAILSFDWSPHKTGSGNIDKVNVVVEIVGSGKVVTSSGLASVSDPFENDWVKGQMAWKTSQVEIKGYSPTDRIIIRPEYLENHDGVTQMRWYLDNIVMNTGDAQETEKVLFEDDFGWMTPLIEEYNKTASKPIGKSVENNDPGAEAPNGYSAAVSIITGFYEKGYVDIHPEWKVMYPQDAYWKMGKTCDKKVETNGKYNVTGIVLPDFLAKNKASKVNVTFNWACHRRVLNEGKENETKETDPVKVVVEVIKNLSYVTDASKAATYDVVSTSSALETQQPVDKMEWQTASVVLEGLSDGDRILIRPENMKPAKSTVNRWYIDNIKVTEAK